MTTPTPPDESDASTAHDAARTADREAERTITRILYDGDLVTEPVDHDDLAGTVYTPPGEGPHPAVLNLHGSGGSSSGRFARLLASNGYAVFSVRYFGEADPLPDELAQVPLSYFDTAAAWFRGQPEVADGPLGLVGASRGGELALLLGARYDWAGAVVTYAGSGIAYDTPAGIPAWIADGEPIPHISGEGAPDRVDGRVVTRPVLERGLDAASDDERRRATIPVERIDGGVLLLSGGADPVWPAQRLSAIAAERLERRGHDHPAEHLTYDQVGHLIGVPYAPTSSVAHGGSSARATAHAAADSWPVVLEFLDRGLPSKD